MYTISPVTMKHADAFFVKISILDLQEIIYSINDVIVSAKMATAELIFYLGKQAVVYLKRSA